MIGLPLACINPRRRSVLRIAIIFSIAFATLPGQAVSATLLVLGDSLSAAYGLAAEQGWVALLEKRLAARRQPWRVINVSISGETTAGGASAIQAALDVHTPSVVMIELGANDGLRGLPLDATAANLRRIIIAAKVANAAVLLIGMRIPPNYGPDYTAAFEAMYHDLARELDVTLLPFLLAPIATESSAFQADGLHPVALAQPRVLEHVWSELRALIERVETAAPVE